MKIGAYVQLVKLRLSMLVVFSAAIGFSLASTGVFDWYKFTILVIGGFFVTGSANGLNQVIERNLDKLMKRTAGRPLPTGVLSVTEALTFSLILGIAGISLLYFATNPLTAFLALCSLLSYAFVYTPLKQYTSFSVFVGAIPGALPPMLGWVAATGTLGYEAWILFAVQFVWQFPHFWAIAWVLDDDYKLAGFRLLPSSGGRDKSSAFQTMFYTLILIPVSLLPVKFGMAGIILGIVSLVCGILFFLQAVHLYRTCSVKAASQLMFGSFLYLPIVQITLIIDRIG